MENHLAQRSKTQSLTTCGLLAAFFMAMALSFKGFVLIPSITEVRPVNSLPILYGLFFGPVGAIACAVGNLLGDALGGTLTPASAAGFIGNYAAAYIPYKIWGACLRSPEETILKVEGPSGVIKFWLLAFFGAMAPAVIIPPAADAMGLASFSMFFGIILLNDLVGTATLGLFLYIVFSRIVMNGKVKEIRDAVFTLEPVKHGQKSAMLLIVSLLAAVAASLFLIFTHGTAGGQNDILIPIAIMDVLVVIFMLA